MRLSLVCLLVSSRPFWSVSPLVFTFFCFVFFPFSHFSLFLLFESL
ncbi:p5 [Blackberry yellow vein-associated virus]|uniref:p5 n=1 Tax=Blackberry yellow vein-associated virus TaxID=404196 RepID=Q5ICV3_9CLOS|nr:p5 [Blackberry yellow vein-associated virus]AAV40964.1 p5 [Blackberry yellow vein-associated virus]